MRFAILLLSGCAAYAATPTATETCRTQLTACQGQVSTLTASNTKLTSDLAAANATIATKTTENATLTTSLATANTSLAAKQSQLDATLATLATQTQLLSIVQVGLSECENVVAAFVPKQAALDAMQAWVDAQQVFVGTLPAAGVTVPVLP